MRKQFLDTGKIVGTHGIRGEVRIDPWCDSPEFLCAFKKLYLDENGETFEENAILKAKSPSCGCGLIYDGTFSGTLKEGNGVTAELLLENGITVTVKD